MEKDFGGRARRRINIYTCTRRFLNHKTITLMKINTIIYNELYNDCMPV